MTHLGVEELLVVYVGYYYSDIAKYVHKQIGGTSYWMIEYFAKKYLLGLSFLWTKFDRG